MDCGILLDFWKDMDSHVYNLANCFLSVPPPPHDKIILNLMVNSNCCPTFLRTSHPDWTCSTWFWNAQFEFSASSGRKSQADLLGGWGVSLPVKNLKQIFPAAETRSNQICCTNGDSNTLLIVSGDGGDILKSHLGPNLFLVFAPPPHSPPQAVIYSHKMLHKGSLVG